MEIAKEKLDRYLKKIRGPICPLCGEQDWNVTAKVFQVTEFHYNKMQIGGPAIPIIPITCSNCGNTYFVNALIAKLIDPSELEKKSDRDESADGDTHE